MKPNGFEYYEYLLVYVDDVLAISHDPKPLIEEIGKTYGLKKGRVGPPTRYLGATISKFQILGDKTGREYWAMSAREYVQEAVRIVKDLLAKERKTLKMNHVSTPFPTSYRPELDMTPELGPELASRYSQLIGMLRWAIELSRINICCEVSVLSQHLALPRQGHLDMVYHVFAYLNKHENSKIVFDPTAVEWRTRMFSGM